MACDHYLRLGDGTGICLDLVIPYRRKWPWPPDPPDWFERLKEFVNEGGGPFPDPRREVTDILDVIKVPDVEQGAWSRDLARVVTIADMVSQLESGDLRERLGAELQAQGDALLEANLPRARLGLSV